MYKFNEMWSGQLHVFYFGLNNNNTDIYFLSFVQTLTLSVLDSANILIMHMVGIAAMTGLTFSTFIQVYFFNVLGHIAVGVSVVLCYIMSIRVNVIFVLL